MKYYDSHNQIIQIRRLLAMSVQHRTFLSILTIIALVIATPFSISATVVGPDDSYRAAGDGAWSDNITVQDGAGHKSPSIALGNNTLHTVFLNSEVLYSRSKDGGGTWSEALTLGPEGQDTPKTPSVAAEGDLVVVVWSAKKDATTKVIYWARSTDGGETFENSSYLAGSNGKEANQPKIKIESGTIYVLWADNRDDPLLEHDLFLKKSLDGGDTWGNDKHVTNALKDSFNPDFEVVGDKIHVVWEDERDGPHWTYYKNSTNGGTSFGAATVICQGIEASMPNLAIDGDKVHVTWWQPSFNLYYLRSDDGGVSWGSPSTIVSGGTTTRSEGVIEAHGSYLEFVYNQAGDLFYMNSTDSGDNWNSALLLGSAMPATGFEGYWNPLITSDDGSFLVYNNDTTGLMYKFKGQVSDLSISGSDVDFGTSFSDGELTAINITATVHNAGDVPAWGAEVRFYEGNIAPANLIGVNYTGTIPVGGQDDVGMLWHPESNSPDVNVKVSSRGPLELELSNNEVSLQPDINMIPISSISISQQEVSTLEDIHIMGDSSSDADGSIDAYWYDMGDGNTTGWDGEDQFYYNYTNDGNYTIQMRVRDNEGAVSLWKSVNVTVTNRGPTAVIALEFQGPGVKTFESFNVSGTDSIDLDGDIMFYEWDLGDGNTSFEPSFTYHYEDAGEYTIVLKVTDDDGASNTTETYIGISNQFPTISVSVDNDVINKGASVTFDASGCVDPDGVIVFYEWSFGDGKTGEGVTIEHQYKEAGEFEVILTIGDNKGARVLTRINITVIDRAPAAVVSADKVEVNTLEFVSFDSKGSFDPDGQIQSYHWDFGDGTTSEAIAPKHTFAKAGTYTVNLTVTDEAGQNASATISIKVLNRLPKAEIRADKMVSETDEVINFTAMYSSDEDGTLVSYNWDFGDGATAEGMNVSHNFSKADSYTVELYVVDDDDGSSTVVSVTIKVTEPYVPPPPPPNGGGDDDKGRMLLFAGVGAVVIVIVVVLVVFLMMRRKGPSSTDPGPYEVDQQDPSVYEHDQGGPMEPPQEGYGPPPQEGYEAPPQEEGYGPPPQEGYEAPPQEGYGPPPQEGYEAPPHEEGYGPPPQEGYEGPPPESDRAPPPPAP
jgi:PKD repeat protein